jgi:two-component system OmpR family response regulator
MPHLLLVEDDAKLASVLRRGLEEESFEVVVTGDGPSALKALLESAFEICVLDGRIPGFDGFEVLRRARLAGVATPVVMLTAADATDDRVRGLNLGADDYLTKPFAFAELLARIHAVLRRAPAPPPSKLACGPVSLDPKSRRAWVDQVEVELSQKQFDLLHLLLSNTGEVLSRERILKEVWGYEFDPGTNVVDVHIAALRQKIDRGGISLIRTVRGVGYSIEPPK